MKNLLKVLSIIAFGADDKALPDVGGAGRRSALGKAERGRRDDVRKAARAARRKGRRSRA